MQLFNAIIFVYYKYLLKLFIKIIYYEYSLKLFIVNIHILLVI